MKYFFNKLMAELNYVSILLSRANFSPENRSTSFYDLQWISNFFVLDRREGLVVISSFERKCVRYGQVH